MKFRTVCVLSLPFVVTTAFVGCSGASTTEPSEECAELGSLCHEPGETNAEAEVCHEIGHEGDAHACSQVYEDCIALCEELHGAGGAGGAGGATH